MTPHQFISIFLSAACWNMALNDPAAPPPRSVGKSLLLVDYIEGNILSQGRLRKKRKRSKHKDEPFVKDGKLSRKERNIICQSCGNTGHNKATCKGQGRKATTVGQDGSGGSGASAVIGLSTATGQGGADGPGGAGVSCQVSETRNADGREMGNGIPTQSSAAGGASEWSFL
ncbi:hypothetical protein Tco_1273293 [Tanacetum coccineum]